MRRDEDSYPWRLNQISLKWRHKDKKFSKIEKKHGALEVELFGLKVEMRIHFFSIIMKREGK